MEKLKNTALYTLLCALLLLATACDSDKNHDDTINQEVQDAGGDVVVADSDDLPAPVATTDSASVAEPEQNPATPPADASPQPRPKQGVKPQPEKKKEAPLPPASEQGFREGGYRLVKVQGESLPLVLDMTTECDIKLRSGELVLMNGRFQFKSTTAEECAGEVPKSEVREAAGSYRIEDGRIYLTVESGEVLGDASGVVEGNSIRLEQISNDVEQQEVNWVFEQQ